MLNSFFLVHLFCCCCVFFRVFFFPSFAFCAPIYLISILLRIAKTKHVGCAIHTYIKPITTHVFKSKFFGLLCFAFSVLPNSDLFSFISTLHFPSLSYAKKKKNIYSMFALHRPCEHCAHCGKTKKNNNKYVLNDKCISKRLHLHRDKCVYR